MAVSPVGNAYTPPVQPVADDTIGFNEAVKEAKNNEPIALYGGGPNSVELTNSTNETMVVEFRSNLDPDATAEERAASMQYVEIAAGQTVTIELPAEWGGNARKFVPGVDTANLAEFTFAGGQLWYNEGGETGRNASILMETSDGQSAGSAQSIMENAPEGSYVYDSNGDKVLLKPKENEAAFNYLTETLGPDNVYIHSEDHTALRSMITNNLSITFGEA